MNTIVTIMIFTVATTVTSDEIAEDDETKQKKELEEDSFTDFIQLFKFVFDDIGDSNLSPRIEEDEKKLVFPNIISNYQKCYSCRLNPYLNKDTCENFVTANENDNNSESNNTCLSHTDFCASFHYHIRFTANNQSGTFHKFETGYGGLGCYRNLCRKEGCYKDTFKNPFNEAPDNRPWIFETVDICCCKGDYCNRLDAVTPELSGLSAPSSSNDTGAGAGARTASGEDEVNRSGLSAALIIVAGLSLALAATFTLSLALGKLGATRGEYSLNTR